MGPPNNVEAYMQETGRAGRNSLPSQAVLFCGPGQLRKDMVDTCMIDYCNNTDLCRCSLLLKEFDDSSDTISSLVVNRCECCDVCSKLASL